MEYKTLVVLFAVVSALMILQKRVLVLSCLFLFLIGFSVSGEMNSLHNGVGIQGYTISQSDEGVVDYLIVTSEDYEDVLHPLVEWKMQRGLISTIETVEDISNNYEGDDLAEKIRNCIIAYHRDNSTIWVLLAGDSDIVPTRSVSVGGSSVNSDYYYSNLDDNWNFRYGVTTLNDPDDWEPEVYVGRLPANSSSQLVSLITRLIQYERNPPVGDWMGHAMYAGTFCNFDYDLNGNNVFDEGDFPAFDTNSNHNWMKSNLLPEGWTSTLLAETEGIRTTDYPYDFQLNETSLVDAINSGASIIMADAHGSTTGMFRTVFTNDVDGDTLFDSSTDQQSGYPFLTTTTDFDVDGKYGFYFLAACSTGSFTDGTCLTEYITQTSGIGCIGSSQLAGYDPFMYTYGGEEHLGWVTQGLSERVWEQILVEGNNHPGMALALAKNDYSLDRVLYNGDDDSGRTMAQYNLMGDPEVPLWIGVPSTFDTPTIDLDEESREVTVQVNEPASMMDEVLITLRSSTYFQRMTSTSSGEVILDMPVLTEAENITITLSKDGYIPLQIEVELPAGQVEIPDDTPMIDFIPIVGTFTIFGLVLVILYWYKMKKP